MKFAIHSPTQGTFYNRTRNEHCNEPTLFTSREVAENVLSDMHLKAYTPDAEVWEIPPDEVHVFKVKGG
jgi:hypothetical protein